MYYLMFLLGMIFIFFKDKYKILLKTYAILLFVFASLRYGVGQDYFGYKYLYSRYLSEPLYEFANKLSREEIGFRLLASIFKMLGLSYESFIAFISALTMIIVYIICKKYSILPLLSLLVFYSSFYLVWIFSGIRQGFTIFAAMLLVIYCFNKQRNIMLIIGTFILSLFHASVLIIIPIYFLAKIKWDKTYLFALTILSIFLSVLPFNFITFLAKLSPIANRVTYYENSNGFINLDFQSFTRIIFVIIAILFYNSLLEEDKLLNFVLKYYILGAFSYFLFKDIELIASRLSIYFRVFEMLIIPSMIVKASKYKNSTLYGIAVIIFLLTYFNKDLIVMGRNTLYNSDKLYYIPYTNIFNKNQYIFTKNEFYKNLNINLE